MVQYARPSELAEALETLASGRWTILAGATDHFPARVDRPLAEDILDVTGIEDLIGIEKADDHWWIGAATTWSQIVDATLPPLFDGLKRAGREVGGRQIQNRATLVGNLCNASPAADGVPVLLTLDAEVEVASRLGGKLIPLADFVVGNRRTLLGPGEMVTGVQIPRPPGMTRSDFLKLGARRYLVISIVSVAGRLDCDADGVVTRAGIAVGACSAVPQRLAALEAALVGRALGRELAAQVTPEHLAVLSPIDDCRAGAGYRRDAAVTMTRRLLERLGTVS